MARNIKTLQKRIERIRTQLLDLGDLRPGYLSEQYNVCGKAACRCKSDPSARHGPYYQLGWTRKSKSTSRFIHREDVATVREQVRNYKRLQKLVEEWIDASMELCDIKLKSGKETAAKP